MLDTSIPDVHDSEWSESNQYNDEETGDVERSELCDEQGQPLQQDDAESEVGHRDRPPLEVIRIGMLQF